MTSDRSPAAVPNRDRSTRLTGLVCGALVVLGAIASYGLWQRLDSSNGRPTTSEAASSTSDSRDSREPDAAPSTDLASVSVTVYWLRDTGTQLETVSASLDVEVAADSQNRSVDRLEAALTYLLEGEVPDAAIDTIPDDVAIERLDVQEDGIYLDLSPAFAFGGGSATMQGRLAQVLYTATELDPEAALWLSVGGEPLTLLGGEGLDVPQPLTRENFEANFSL